MVKFDLLVFLRFGPMVKNLAFRISYDSAFRIRPNGPVRSRADAVPDLISSDLHLSVLKCRCLTYEWWQYRSENNKQWLHCRKWQFLMAYMAHKWLSWYKKSVNANFLFLLLLLLLLLMYHISLKWVVRCDSEIG